MGKESLKKIVVRSEERKRRDSVEKKGPKKGEGWGKKKDSAKKEGGLRGH